ncbi:MAG TPA: toll/interleukin-1 receptor domain-containing protein [Chthoniobacterales bacterium]|jgi:hypothetical protein|nr:toll/interleukin-1 receptor domain-containing protein [Chthoniobacterales bacterium]
MADVFISNSRKDKGFVHRLDEALKSREREAWVDWEGIRPTEEFMQAIFAAFEGADTFIFVLTPDSVASVRPLPYRRLVPREYARRNSNCVRRDRERSQYEGLETFFLSFELNCVLLS